jgi:hypothetical protein
MFSTNSVRMRPDRERSAIEISPWRDPSNLEDGRNEVNVRGDAVLNGANGNTGSTNEEWDTDIFFKPARFARL